MNLNEDFSKYSRYRDVGRWYVTGFVRRTAAELPPGSLVLDAGAGECVYKPLFGHCRYLAVDLAVGDAAWNYHNLDAISVLHRLPFPSNTFDAVLSTQTLEHLSLPQASVCELHRVLKAGGRLYLTAPMSHVEHQAPYDFFRYTSYGLRHLATQAGFASGDIRVEPFGGMFTRWGYELAELGGLFVNTGVSRLPAKVFTFAIMRALRVCLFALDRFDKRRVHPFGWGMTATKSQRIVERMPS